MTFLKSVRCFFQLPDELCSIAPLWKVELQIKHISLKLVFQVFRDDDVIALRTP